MSLFSLPLWHQYGTRKFDMSVDDRPTNKRIPISKKLRFEVFKRDSFTCQYCGKMAPEAVLQIDHINPIKNGGDNDLLNLITSCFECNNGKGATKLTDRQEIQKQQEQLRLLSQKREQLEFLVKWRSELLSLSEKEVDIAESEIYKHSNDNSCTLSDVGRQKIRDMISKFSLNEVLEAISIAYKTYYKSNTVESWCAAFNKIGGICNNRRNEKIDPTYIFRQKAYYFFRKHLPVYNEVRVKNTIRNIVKDEDTMYKFFEIVDSCRNWTQFFEMVDEDAGGDNGA